MIITDPLDELSLLLMHSVILLIVYIEVALTVLLPFRINLLLLHHRLHISDADTACICGRLGEVAQRTAHYFFLFGKGVVLHVGEQCAPTLTST